MNHEQLISLLSELGAQRRKFTGKPKCKGCFSDNVKIITEDRVQCDDCFRFSKPAEIDDDCTTCSVCTEEIGVMTKVWLCARCYKFTCKACIAKLSKKKCPLCRCSTGKTYIKRSSTALRHITGDLKVQLMELAVCLCMKQMQGEPLRMFVGDLIKEYLRWLTAMIPYSENPQGTFLPKKIISLVWSLHASMTRNYLKTCELLCGKVIYHTVTPGMFPLNPEFDFDKAEQKAQELMWKEPLFDDYSKEIWGARPCDEPSTAFMLDPVGEIRIKKLDGISLCGPYHPKYTGRDLQLKFKLENSHLRTQTGKLVEAGITLEEQEITPATLLVAIAKN